MPVSSLVFPFVDRYSICCISSETSVMVMAFFGHPESVKVLCRSCAGVFVSKLMQLERSPGRMLKPFLYQEMAHNTELISV